MDSHRKLWNTQQQALRRALSRPADHAQAIELFLSQHAMVHSAEMAQAGLWSFEDEVWQGLSEAATRRIPPGGEHSIAWIFWHLTRIEDITMNVLLAGGPQVLAQGGWLEQIKVTVCDTGNAMHEADIAGLSAAIDIRALRAYRLAVGRRTRQVVQGLRPEDLEQSVDPARLQQLLDEGAVEEEARGLLDYWGGLTKAGLLLMPPTRHNIVHLNEALRLKGKR